MTARNIELHIDELILHGVSPHERHHVSASLERELSRLFTEEGLPQPEARDAASMDLGVITLPAGHAQGAGEIGTHVARAVYRSLAAPPSQGRGGQKS